MNKKNNIENIVESNISIICPSPNGKEIAKKLQKILNAKLYIKENDNSLRDINRYFRVKTNEVSNEEDGQNYMEAVTYRYGEDFKLHDVTRQTMKNSQAIIFISSTGIAVRAIAPFLKGKDKDPGVVVVDLSCKYAINILSGHLGGGNELTFKVSKILNVMPIITTASDNLGIIAPDLLAKQNNLVIEDLKKAKHIASVLVDKKTIGVKDDYNMVLISKGYESVEKLRENCIWITHNLKDNSQENISEEADYSKVLRLIKKDIVLGIGCRRGTPYEKLKEFISDKLIKYNLDIRSVAIVVSVDVKANEDGIIKLAENLNCPFKTFSREEIKKVQDKYDKSEFVLKTIGVTSVCEPCVDIAGAEIITSKIKHKGMTLAIGVLRHIS
ncbi:cobalt-precorrin 5A hydrolase [Clostridium sp.]|uniref:cobalt-precorrin 5A hydrolase n=1 Tax=Clostridium sp. TaxID=1506 RepID=UPI002851F738|nr:cobalt-precorrin 5A hydrolase [Clostridium sp.]MDR3597904.1 cobalt-precorrin 5A hydrolase [Clostridium sp.]